jgi:transcriptional regulator with XRE-family HTH domain
MRLQVDVNMFTLVGQGENGEHCEMSDPPTPKKARHALQEWCFQNGTSMAEIASRLGVSRAALHHWVNGNRKISSPVASQVLEITDGTVTLGDWPWLYFPDSGTVIDRRDFRSDGGIDRLEIKTRLEDGTTALAKIKEALRIVAGAVENAERARYLLAQVRKDPESEDLPAQRDSGREYVHAALEVNRAIGQFAEVQDLMKEANWHLAGPDKIRIWQSKSSKGQKS